MSLVGPRPLADEEMVGDDIWRELSFGQAWDDRPVANNWETAVNSAD